MSGVNRLILADIPEGTKGEEYLKAIDAAFSPEAIANKKVTCDCKGDCSC